MTKPRENQKTKKTKTVWRSFGFKSKDGFHLDEVFFSVFPVVLVLATRCIPLAKFGSMFAVKQMMANLMQGTCRGGVSAERRNIYIY